MKICGTILLEEADLLACQIRSHYLDTNSKADSKAMVFQTEFLVFFPKRFWHQVEYRPERLNQRKPYNEIQSNNHSLPSSVSSDSTTTSTRESKYSSKLPPATCKCPRRVDLWNRLCSKFLVICIVHKCLYVHSILRLMSSDTKVPLIGKRFSPAVVFHMFRVYVEDHLKKNTSKNNRDGRNRYDCSRGRGFRTSTSSNSSATVCQTQKCLASGQKIEQRGDWTSALHQLSFSGIVQNAPLALQPVVPESKAICDGKPDEKVRTLKRIQFCSKP